MCLHPHGRIYKIFKNRIAKSSLPAFFYSHEVGNINKKKKRKFKNKKFVDDEKYLHKRKHRKTDRSLGLGDLMILFILQIQWSLLTKILVIFGCIISIKVGHCTTFFIEQS